MITTIKKYLRKRHLRMHCQDAISTIEEQAKRISALLDNIIGITDNNIIVLEDVSEKVEIQRKYYGGEEVINI